jgi:ABC-2 type transport system permease protein
MAKLRLMVSVLIFMAVLASYVFLSNRDFFSGNEIAIPAESVGWLNWEQTADGYVSIADPQIVIAGADEPRRIDSIGMRCRITGEINPKIYYTTAKEEAFSEEKTLEPAFKYKGELLTLKTNLEAVALRIDLSDAPGLVLSNVGSLFYFKSFRIDVAEAIPIVSITFLVLFLLFRPLISWKITFFRINDFKKYSYLLKNLVKKDFTTRYRRSVLGILWSVLNPLLMMMVISAVFSNIFRIQVENFAIYYLTGALVFNFMSEATSGSLTSVLGSAGLIRKVYIPKYIFPLERCFFALVNAVFSLIAVLILMPILGVPLRPTALLFWVPLAYTLVFCVGLGMVLAAANVFFRDIGHLYSVWVTAWMYLTPILYPVDILPDAVRGFVTINPMYYYVDYFRQVMMYESVPDLQTNLICASFSLVFLLLGLIVFKKTQDRFILYF